LDVVEQCPYTFVCLPQRLAYSAASALLASAGVIRQARCNKERTVDRTNHFQRGNLPRIASEGIASVASVMRHQQLRLRQLLQNLGEGLSRQAVSLSDILSAA